MIYSLKKINMLLASVVMTAAGTLSGNEHISVYGDRDACCDEPPCCADCDCGQLSLRAELLYLRPFQGGLSSVCDDTEIFNSTVDGVLTSTLEGQNHDPHFRWDLGYRVGLGYGSRDSQCGAEALWTHFQSHCGDSDDEHHWDIKYDVIDGLFGCQYDCSSCFSVIPFGGIKYARIDQKLHLNLVNIVDGLITSTIAGTIKERFSGVGPMFGVEGDWRLGCGFSLYGNISIAALYGNFHVSSNQNEVSGTTTNINLLKNRTQATQAVVDAKLGIRWATCLCNDNYLSVQLGVETHRYFNHNQFCGYGDLSLDGGTLAVAVTF